MKEARRLNKMGEPSLATTLADELTIASRAAERANAVRRGTRVLWAGVFIGALGRCCGADASATGTFVLISLISAFSVVVAALWKKRSSASETRSRALLAARRLERYFPEQAGVWVAAVDFCCDAVREEEGSARTSADLRNATITLATRRLATAASETSVADWRAALTGEKSELFRNLRKKNGVCVLSVLINLALWGSAIVDEVDVNEKNRPTARAEVGETSDSVDKNKENCGNKGNKQEGESEIERNKGTLDSEISASAVGDQAPWNGDVLTALEALISDLSQNADLAEFFKAELEDAVVAERTNAEKKEGEEGEATQFLQLARELNANITRPATGILAQVRRLQTELRREETAIGERLEKANGKGERRRKENEEKRAAGVEIALFLLASRLNKFEAKIRVVETQEITSALGLSAVLRNASNAGRAETLEEAARRVDEWATMLRREATAAQILRESWLFDAMSRDWRAATEGAWEKNQILLARFAGRSLLSDVTSSDDSVSFDKAKARFVDAWSEARRLEKERFAIFERLLERLQNEEAKEFCESIGGEEGLAARVDLLGNADWDAAVFDATNVALAQIETRDAKIAEAVENNRFGIVAEELQNVEKKRALEPTASIERIANKRAESAEKTETGNVDRINDELSRDSKEAASVARNEEEGKGRDGKERRLAFLTARLTWGVDEETLYNGVSQNVAGKYVKANDKAADAGASPRRVNEKRRKSDWTTRQEEGKKAVPDEREKYVTSLEEATRQNAEKKVASDAVNEENDYKYGEIRETQEQTKEKYAGSSESENGGEDGEKSSVGETNGDGKKGVSEELEGGQVEENQAFSGELPLELRRRFEGTNAPEILPEYEEKIRLYRRRINSERR